MGTDTRAGGRFVVASGCFCALLTLTACGATLTAQTADLPREKIVARPVATPTPRLGFVRAVVAPPPRHAPCSVWVPPPPRITAATGVRLSVWPATGLPEGRRVWVKASGLPPRIGVSVLFLTSRPEAPLMTNFTTDRRGRVSGSFPLPASPPGIYRFMLELNGIPSAYADYQVVSPARLLATIVPTAGGDILSVVGSCFLAHTGLAVMLVPLDGRMHSRVVGTVVTSASGRLSFRRRLRRQPFGQYLLEVFSVDGRSAQTATTPLQIVG